MELLEKKAIITGASTGLGKAIAEEFVREGAHIVICARNLKKLKETENYLKKLCSKPNQIVDSVSCDISKKDEVEQFFSYAKNLLFGLDILVNNAGIYGPIGESEKVDFNLWAESISINLLGPFYLSQLALIHFKVQKSGKIINISGGGATSPLPNISSYAAAKAGIVCLTETLAKEVQPYGIDINAIAPGALNTKLLDQVIEAGSEKVGKSFYQKALQQQKSGGAPLEKGAKLCVFLASDRSTGITGKLISAIWDPWETLGKHTKQLSSSDIYTLRRIIPEDRGKKWD
jgi:3-oxoacyl-[acyl-carrier protein] reductase